MMRVLEFLAALVIVVAIGVVAAVVMPSSGHVERSVVIGKDMRQVYDLLDNFKRLPEYSVLHSYDPQTKFTDSGKDFGPGSAVNWASDNAKVGHGGLTIASATPGADKIDSNTRKASIVWDLDNSWRGGDKHFTLDLERNGSRGQLTKLTWSYDVKYGWNLVNRFANLYIHGEPDTFIEYSMNNVQAILATVPNVDYSPLVPYIQQTQPTPMLVISTSIQRKDGLDALDTATSTAVSEIQAAAKKLGVNITGPRVLFTTNYGDDVYTFDIGMPIDSSSLTVDGQSAQLTAAKPPSLDDTTAAASSAPAPAGSAAGAATAVALTPGSHDKFGRLVIDNNVRATLAFGGSALEAVWNGTFAGVPQTRDMLKAYAQTHGYTFDEVVNRPYDVLVSPEVKGKDGQVATYPKYAVYLPITNAPAQTPEQAEGVKQPLGVDGSDAPAASGSAPAPASSGAGPAKAASAAN